MTSSPPDPLLADRSFAGLLDAVAAKTPAPAGGSAAAWASALAASLVEMAARFTLARDAYADRHTRMSEIEARADQLRAQLLELADRELRTYEPVLEALRAPREDPERSARLRHARARAADTPLAVSRAAAEVASLGAEVALSGSEHLVGDAVTGALLAEAGCRAAAKLVEINLADAVDDGRLAEAAELLRRAAGARTEALA
jgi:methenyltetrahydrofolate cyclohydrolase